MASDKEEKSSPTDRTLSEAEKPLTSEETRYVTRLSASPGKSGVSFKKERSSSKTFTETVLSRKKATAEIIKRDKKAEKAAGRERFIKMRLSGKAAR